MRKTRSAAVLVALGAAALYAVSIPLSPFLLRQPLSPLYPFALALMLLGPALTVRETLAEVPSQP